MTNGKLVFGTGYTDPSKYFVNVLLGNRALQANIKIDDFNDDEFDFVGHISRQFGTTEFNKQIEEMKS